VPVGQTPTVLPLTLDTFRLALHVLAATVWVGGQITLAGLVPGLRALDPDAPRAVARRFNRIAWPAYGVLVATGIWNLVESSFGDRSSAWQVTLFVKLVVVGLAGIAALVHSAASSKAVLAAGGALAGLSSLAAVLLGVQLTLGG
jgi:putative copper export protein